CDPIWKVPPGMRTIPPGTPAAGTAPAVEAPDTEPAIGRGSCRPDPGFGACRPDPGLGACRSGPGCGDGWPGPDWGGGQPARGCDVVGLSAGSAAVRTHLPAPWSPGWVRAARALRARRPRCPPAGTALPGCRTGPGRTGPRRC